MRSVVGATIMLLGICCTHLTLANTSIPPNNTEPKQPQAQDNKSQIVYKRKKEDNSYPMEASSYEDSFLKSLMGINMQDKK